MTLNRLSQMGRNSVAIVISELQQQQQAIDTFGDQTDNEIFLSAQRKKIILLHFSFFRFTLSIHAAYY